MRLELTERDFSTAVEDLLSTFGWRWTHFRPARTEHSWVTALSGHKGFLDYIAVRLSRLLIFELKSERGKLTPDQTEWLDALEATGKVEVYIWKPGDWFQILECLR